MPPGPPFSCAAAPSVGLGWWSVCAKRAGRASEHPASSAERLLLFFCPVMVFAAPCVFVSMGTGELSCVTCCSKPLPPQCPLRIAARQPQALAGVVPYSGGRGSVLRCGKCSGVGKMLGCRAGRCRDGLAPSRLSTAKPSATFSPKHTIAGELLRLATRLWGRSQQRQQQPSWCSGGAAEALLVCQHFMPRYTAPDQWALNWCDAHSAGKQSPTPRETRPWRRLGGTDGS